MTLPPLVHIHYLRPPDRKDVFSQHLLLDTPEVKVTFARDLPFCPPIRILGRVALEKGSDAVWFTFPGLWHDIGRFHRADGTFTGIYANILTPVRISQPDLWHTTDLFLDVWIDPEGELTVLDRDHLDDALEKGWVSGETAGRAQAEVDHIKKAFNRGQWPPDIVEEWTLKRAREAMDPERA